MLEDGGIIVSSGGNVVQTMTISMASDNDLRGLTSPSSPDERTPDAHELVGTVLSDRYVILEALSESQFATVFLGNDLVSGTTVAIKALRYQDEELSKAFAFEIEQIRYLQHENIVDLVDCQEFAGKAFSVMEFVEGTNLAQLLDSIKRIETEEQIASTTLQICDAIAFLHLSGCGVYTVLTDDVLLIDTDGETKVKLTGIGTANVKEILRRRGERNVEGEPDQNSSSTEEERSVYEIASLTYEMVTGRKPFENFMSDSLTGFSDQPVLERVSLLRPDLFKAAGLDDVLHRALFRGEPGSFKTIGEFSLAIQAWLLDAQAELRDSLKDPHGALVETTARQWVSFHVEAGEQKIGLLKNAQHKGEETIGMLFTRLMALRGRRESPLLTMVQLIALAAAGGVSIFFILQFVRENLDELRTRYVEASTVLSSKFSYSSKITSSLPAREVFSYADDPSYERWTTSRVIGHSRRVDPDFDFEQE